MKKRVLLGMSGGIDSAVSAFLLKEQGYEIVGGFMKYWNDTSSIDKEILKTCPENKCCSNESFASAKQIGDQLGFEVHKIDYINQFKEDVVDTFIDSHKQGLTPNPCITCNQKIKFGIFFDKMKELNCDYIATGHYANIKEVDGKLFMFSGKDNLKDQSYFLYHLNQEQLSKIIFPVGEYNKSQIKELGIKYGLNKVVEKKESQGVCFFPEESYVPFLKRYAQNIFNPGGDILYKDKKIGEHKGLPYYTIGQRRGIGIGGFKDPVYVIGMNYNKNILLLGDETELYKNNLIAKKFIFHEEIGDNEVFARIRHLGNLNKCKIKVLGKNKVKVLFSEPVRSVTPGQLVVIYDKNNRVLGGGEII